MAKKTQPDTAACACVMMCAGVITELTHAMRLLNPQEGGPTRMDKKRALEFLNSASLQLKSVDVLIVEAERELENNLHKTGLN